MSIGCGIGKRRVTTPAARFSVGKPTARTMSPIKCAIASFLDDRFRDSGAASG
jgi:hypothetical protein